MKLNKLKYSVNTVFLRSIATVYEGMFHEKMSKDVVDFFKKVYYVGIGTIIATIFSFVFNILAGRIVGPSEYGKFALVQSVAMFLFVPMVLGLNNAMVKYNAEKNDYYRQRGIISTAYILVFALTTISTSIFYIFSHQISKVFSVSYESFHLSILFSVSYVFYFMATSALRSLHKMKMLSALHPIFSINLLLSLAFFIYIGEISFKSIVFSMYIGHILTGSIILLYIKKYIIFDIDMRWVKIFSKYCRYSVLSGISFIIYTNIDKIMINKYMLEANVGLYNAYYYGSINLMGIFSGIFMTVFFPTASQYDNKKPIFNKINKFTPYLLLLGVPIVLFAELIILKLFGENYQIDISLAIIFAIASILVTCYTTYVWLFNSEGENGVKLVLSSTGTIGITNIILNAYLIPIFGLQGAIGATVLAYCIGITLIYSRGRNFMIAKRIQTA